MSVFMVGAGPDRKAAPVPVIPGRDGVHKIRTIPACAACGYGDSNGVVRRHVVVEGVRLVLCVDYAACVGRMRWAVAR